ncbi:LLM class flavin-dependent oxidoreductase [Nonomuraea africana]|uniref:Alkanesulfonate monooxygenase SsuD/methylene tetrahydromethanopterin reductase-like flavin-dependent oxidoreductase (Luciferase family) n=1 Tax=Nonomuraea africana TaxID=46171 RepID=A0ABR9KRH9_9ACTN|nr:LLM class flavin-dependent oxidoreductase [Nonomuraea africana]MBE1564633.1 alkanesulfonate monooxygenase SsuD/methylene tetrahydromethanopterin reductase-like flavin-dependent oxidoreductase (luciferase family) [Nonomuraea africana]
MTLGLAVPFVDPAALVAWARRADAGPYGRVGVPDRIVYDNPETMVMLGAMTAVTERIRVQSEVVLAPLRDPVLLAKQSATLDRLSGGRFTLGLGVGAREDDFQAVGADHASRGRRMDEQLATMRQVWAGEPVAPSLGPVGPSPVKAGGPELLFGGFAPPALARVARWGAGYICPAPPGYAGALFEFVRRQWKDAGRPGEPLLVAQINVALGPESTVAEARASLLRYYAFAPELAAQSLQAMATTAKEIRETVAAYRDLGAHEVMLSCWSDDIEQIDRLADLLA